MAYSENSRRNRLWQGLALLAALLSACGGGDGDGNGDGDGPEGGESFETAWPGADGARGQAGTDDAASGVAVPGAANSAADAEFSNGDGDGGEAAARVIQEADIIQVDGDRLYALSRMSGLNVVDISDHDDMRILGTFANTRDAEPFEMYIDGDVALVMFSGWGDYVWVDESAGDGGGGFSWVQSSQLVALDVGEPASIEELGAFHVPGSISDSRIVGEVLYVVGYEDGYCWDCAEGQPRTSVVSLDVSDPRNIAKVDELYFNDASNAWGWGRRSVTVTSERMYVAGIEESGTGEPDGSTIQVIDITDPEGDMVLGAEVEAAGQISSRWQMDEHEGVLRVISQPPDWRLTDPPVIQTFTVVSSAEVTPLGSATMRLPRPEQLQSVRFDGPRAYAITFERTDPLFTIDLSNPAEPAQLGELEIPGFVYHMEPRGDRVIGLGFDQRNPEGSITVSLFDVSNLAEPTMISRVNFGGDWGYLPEDQNRIHKVFRVLDEQGLILVPHSGYDEVEIRADEEGRFIEECYRGGYDSSHVQLVDFTLDSLTLRGSMPTRGEARRALLHGGDVLTVSDQQVDAYDISDRSAPELLGGVALARNVSRALPMNGGVIARVTNDWWSDDFSVDFVTAGEAHLPSAGMGELSLSDAIRGDDECGYFWTRDVMTDGDHLMVFYEREEWKSDDYKQAQGLLVVDASNPAAPEVLSKTEWTMDRNWWTYGGQWTHGIPVGGRDITRFAGGAALLESGYVDEGSDRGHEEFRLRVIDLRDLSAPESHVIELPSRNGYFALRASGETLVTSHFEVVAGSSGLARFYLDRIDVQDPGAPELLAPINVPGVVMHYDVEDGYAVTMDLARSEAPSLQWDQCAERFATFEFEWDTRGETGTCVGYEQIVRLVRISGGGASLQASHAMGDELALRRMEVAGDVLVGTTGRGDYYGGFATDIAIADCFGPCGFYYDVPEPEQLLVLSGMTEGELRLGTLELEQGADPWAGWWGASSLVADGDRALVTGRGELAIIDLDNPVEPRLDRVEPFAGYMSNVSVRDGRVAMALGEKGCRVIDM